MKGFIILFSIFASIYAQGQDLCGDAEAEPTTGFTFADDPSSCTAYLWCNFRGTSLVSVHQGNCMPGFNFNAARSTCDPTLECTEKCELVDPAVTVRVAVPDDITCRRFQTCNGPEVLPTVFECTAPSVFNRNFGVCTTASIAPCEGGGGDGADAICEVGNDGFFNDDSGCAKFIFCKGGVGTRETCPNDFHFNPNGNFCDLPANLNPPCTDPLGSQNKFEIPKPPHVINGVKVAYRTALRI